VRGDLRSRNVLWMHDVKYVYIGRRGGGIVQSKGVKSACADAKSCRDEAIVSGHKYKIGQLANYLSRERASGIYQITQLLPPERGQYRIKNVNEPHESVAKEIELRRPSAPE
jgi:hypothetical protein